MALAVVHDLREARAPAGPDELAAFETDTLAGLVLARAAAGLADRTIAGEVIHLDQVRAWLGRPLWTMQPADADTYFGQVLRGAARGTRLARAQALKTYFLFLELRHKVEIHQMTGHVVECPVDEVNRPRGSQDAALRIPPSQAQVGMLFAGWRGELAECRKFAPAARNYAAAKLMAEVGLRVNEACQLDLDDVKWDLGRFGKIHVRIGKGARGSGPRERMVPLINNARATLQWFVQDVWGALRRRPHAARGAAASLRAQEPRRDLRPGRRRGAAGRAGRGRRGSPAGLAGTRHPAPAAALLRQPAVCERDGPGRDPGGPRPFLGRHHHGLHPRPPHPCRGRLDLRPAARRREAEGAADMTAGAPAAGPGEALTGPGRASSTAARAVLHAGGHQGATVIPAAGHTALPAEKGRMMKWNLRLAAAHRGIWTASEMQRLLAARGLSVSAGKMSGLWSGSPASVKLGDLDVICAVLGCGIEELLLPEPGKVAGPAGEEQRQQAAAPAAGAPAVTPRRRDGRSLPPP